MRGTKMRSQLGKYSSVRMLINELVSGGRDTPLNVFYSFVLSPFPIHTPLVCVRNMLGKVRDNFITYSYILL